MAAKTAMSKTQLETLRHKLQNERSRVMRALQDSVARGPAGEQSEVEEAAQRLTERTEQLRVGRAREDTAGGDRSRTGQVRRGTYGVSEKTGTPISFERLNALPWARQDTDE